MSFIEFLIEYYIYILAVLIVLVIGVIGFIVDSKNNEKKKNITVVNNNGNEGNLPSNANVNSNVVNNEVDVNKSVNSVNVGSGLDVNNISFDSVNSSTEVSDVGDENIYTESFNNSVVSDNNVANYNETSNYVVDGSVMSTNVGAFNDTLSNQVNGVVSFPQETVSNNNFGISNAGVGGGTLNNNLSQQSFSQNNVSNVWAGNMVDNNVSLNTNNSFNSIPNGTAMANSNIDVNGNSTFVSGGVAQTVNPQIGQVNNLVDYTINQGMQVAGNGGPVMDSSVQNTYGGMQAVNNGNFQNNNIIIPDGAPYYDGTNMYGGNQ